MSKIDRSSAPQPADISHSRSLLVVGWNSIKLPLWGSLSLRLTRESTIPYRTRYLSLHRVILTTRFIDQPTKWQSIKQIEFPAKITNECARASATTTQPNTFASSLPHPSIHPSITQPMK